VVREMIRILGRLCTSAARAQGSLTPGKWVQGNGKCHIPYNYDDINSPPFQARYNVSVPNAQPGSQDQPSSAPNQGSSEGAAGSWGFDYVWQRHGRDCGYGDCYEWSDGNHGE
jgi:hypothetical protein